MLSFYIRLKEFGFFKYVYCIAILGIVVGLLFSRAVLSIGQITLAACWLLEADFAEKWERLKSSKWPWIWAGLFLIHVVGMLYSADMEYAVHDIRVKLPLLLFPIVLGSIDLPFGLSIKKIMYVFLSTVTGFIGFLLVFNYFKNGHLGGSREMSFLFSHIRLSLILCFSLFVGLYYITKTKDRERMILMLCGTIILSFMAYFAFFTGLVITALLLPFYLIWAQKVEEKRGYKIKGLLLFTILIYAASLIYISSSVYDFFQTKTANGKVENIEKTANGNTYSQLHEWSKNYMKENGNFVLQNVCYVEVQKEWNRVSNVEFDVNDDSKRKIEPAMFRFLTSKGLNKDSVGISKLNKAEIEAIESGVTNVLYMNQSRLYIRIQQILWEIENHLSGGDINGHSVAMRLTYWRSGMELFLRNFWFGVGTGDVPDTFQQYYEESNSILRPEWRLRAHNQIITFGLSFGVFGMLYLLYSLFVPLYSNRQHFLYFVFLSIAILSMISEDTLETQIGVTFYAFFNSLLYFLGGRDVNEVRP